MISGTSPATVATPSSFSDAHSGNLLRRIANRFVPGLGCLEAGSRAHPPSRLVNFGDLIKVVVVGTPTEQELGDLESHLRAINAFLNGTEALRQLREETERRAQYPIMVFKETTDGRPIEFERRRTAGPDEPVLPAVPARRRPQERSPEERHMYRLIRRVSDYLVQSQEGQLTMAQFGVPRRHRPAQRPDVSTRSQLASERFEGMLFDRLSRRNGELGRPGYGHRVRRIPWSSDSQNVGGAQLHGNHDLRPPRHPWSYLLQPWLGADCKVQAERWAAIEREAHSDADRNGIAAFKNFLRRLSGPEMFKDPLQRAEVVKWLAEAALPESAILRAEAFEACVEGTRSCDDNILLTWNKLCMLKIKVDAQEGQYEGRLADLLEIARPIFRMHEIEKVADTKVRALYAARKRRDPSMIDEYGKLKPIDPLETLLAYQIGLREALKLPIHVNQMYFTGLSYIKQPDIDAARAVIEQAEQERFPFWLLTAFPPFMAEIERQLGPETSAKIVEASVEANAATFDDRLVARLRAENLPDSDDPRREMGVLLLRDIQYETWLPHANHILTAAGLDPLPTIDLSETELPASDPTDSTPFA